MTDRPAEVERSPRAAEIVAAARAVLEAEGDSALTMRRLGEELGMRAPSLYKHFPDKAVVESALIEGALFEVGDALHQAVARPGRRTPVASVLHAYRARLETLRDRRHQDPPRSSTRRRPRPSRSFVAEADRHPVFELLPFPADSPTDGELATP